MSAKEYHSSSKTQSLQPETELSVLKEILRWVKFSGMKEVKAILTSTLDDEQKKTVYQMSDGSKGMVEIGRFVGVKSTAKISRLWKHWNKLGLGESIPVMGGERFRRSFDLEDFGIQTTISQGSLAPDIPVVSDVGEEASPAASEALEDE